MSKKEMVYRVVLGNYGNRAHYISELADMLGVTYHDANDLTYNIGYRRGKLVSQTPISDFIANPKIARIIDSIDQKTLEALEAI